MNLGSILATDKESASYIAFYPIIVHKLQEKAIYIHCMGDVKTRMSTSNESSTIAIKLTDGQGVQRPGRMN